MRSEWDHGHHSPGVIDSMNYRDSFRRRRGYGVELVAVSIKLIDVSVVVTVIPDDREMGLVHSTGPVSRILTVSFDG